MEGRKRRLDHSFQDEPTPEGDEWEEYGGELMWVAGYTAGGAPFGLTVEEFRRVNERYEAGAGWARAKYVLRDLLELWCGPPTRAEVGFVKKIGHGLSRDIFAAEVELTPDPRRRSGAFVVLLPRRDADPALDVRTRRELRLLGKLHGQQLPFRVAEVVGAYPESGRLALVRRLLAGFELDLRAGRQPGRPWETVGEIAAAIHTVDGGGFGRFLSGHPTRRDHAENSLRVFDGLDAPEAREARDWATSHLPPAEPSVLVHGDLLGQNILIGLEQPPAVIDWEYARLGDPAYDLAIVTRGGKRPFQIDRGLDRLLDAYHRHGGDAGVSREHVRVHELCLVASWYREALAGARVHPADQELGRLRGLLARAGAERDEPQRHAEAVRTMTRRELVERLEAIVSNACAMSLGHPASDTIDEKVMIEELEHRCHEAQLHAADIVPDLERMEARLKATISELPDRIGEAAWTHRVNNLKWRPDPISMPRAIAVFVVLERIEIARSSCLYLLARARYEELRQGHACDCSARMEADFLHGDPSGPLRLLDSIGVPFAAMDHLWVCETCGQKWAQEEGHDDAGVHTSWRPAAADATRA